MDFIIYNGEIISNEKVLKSNNRAFRYGDGLFESFRTFGKQIPFLKQHLHRLNKGMEILSYHACDCLEEDAVRNMVNLLCAKNNINISARIRLSVFRKEGGLYAPLNNDFDYIIEATACNEPNYSLSTKGLIIGVSKTVKKPINQLSEIKSANALLMVLAAQEAQKNRWNEAIILNEKGFIAEATSSNLYIVKEKTIFTPPISDGAMDGIMRQQIAIITKQSNYKLKVKSLKTADLETADEIFLSNAVRGIIWVVGFDKKRFYNKAAKELHLLLIKHINEITSTQ